MKSQSVLAVLIGFYVSTLHGTPWIRTGTAPSRWGGFLQNDAADSRYKKESRTATAAMRWGGCLKRFLQNNAADSRDKNESRTATAPLRWGGFLQNNAADSRDKKESRTATAPSRFGGWLQNDAADSRDKNESRTATAADDVSCVECICKGKVAAGLKKMTGKCPMRFCQCVN